MRCRPRCCAAARVAVQARLCEEPPQRWPHGGRQINFSGVDGDGIHGQRNIRHTGVQVGLMARQRVTRSMSAALSCALEDVTS